MKTKCICTHDLAMHSRTDHAFLCGCVKFNPVKVVIRQKFIYREDLMSNPSIGYLFGDNLIEKGLGGQAGAMRGEPNAIGVPTKKSPSMDEGSFFTDEEYLENKKHIDKAFTKTIIYDTIVIPLDGLGTGLAQLKERAPRTHEYLEKRIKNLEG